MNDLAGPGRWAEWACLLEATARKPGNVHRGRDFADTSYLDFLLSAGAIREPLDRAGTLGVGPAILGAVRATRTVAPSNTNLGMILLLAPLAAAPPDRPLRAGVAAVLDRLTVADARAAYAAIRLAQPGGLGQSGEQDVADEPTIDLRAAMALAADRDLVARQYALGFPDVFDHALPTLAAEVAAGRSVERAIVAAYLAMLARRPDTLIGRKRGRAVAEEASARSRRVLDLGWPDDPRGRAAGADFDAWLRADGHARNPGATADLMAAALFAALRGGTIPWPVGPRWARDHHGQPDLGED